jgi:uncharacterized heparinase superfamily protein
MPPLIAQLAAIQGMRREQIAARIRLRAIRALRASRPFAAPARRRALAPVDLQARDLGIHVPGREEGRPWMAPVLAAAAEVAAGRFCFLNESRMALPPVDWQAAGAARLWRFHLHYFDDAPLLALAAGATGQPRFREVLGELIADWVDRNPIGAGDGWHPYTLSRRIPNWIYALGLLGGAASLGGGRVLASLRDQARFLAGHLEFDALGNHLLANARALLLAAAFFVGDEAGRWWGMAEAILEREVEEQFLADGGHFERSPMYHALVLQDLMECAALYGRRGVVPAWLCGTIERAETWLRQMLHPDGGVALFNDCTLEGPSWPELSAFRSALLGTGAPCGRPGWRQLAWLGQPPEQGEAMLAAEPSDAPASASLTALRESGYFVLRDPRAGHALFFDAGEPCPGYIPAHAHADLLSIELSLLGQRVIVDSGVCEYEAGPWRDYCRSTRAHNTLQVDGKDQSELWGSFRVGRRAHPIDVRCSASGERVEVSASHTGYRRLRGEVTHRRTVSYDGSTYRISDHVTGSGRHRVESFIHFHPELQLSLGEGGLTAVGQGVRFALRFIGDVRAGLLRGEESPPNLQGWYCPEFGRRQPAPVLVLVRDAPLPTRIDYEIHTL